MPKYAAFLRGINLGSQRRINSAGLRSIFEDVGFDEVNPFRSSGNVVFASGREGRSKMTPRIEKAIASTVGFEVKVFLRTASEVRAIASSKPFAPKLVKGSKGKLQVLLLTGRPPAKAQKEVLKLATGEDRLSFGERELYWLPSGGIAESRLDLKAIDKLLGSTTMRTKGTLEEMAARYLSGR